MQAAPENVTTLVLAGNRRADDPVALHEGVAHKCLAEIDGQTILDRVLCALEASRYGGRIALCHAPESGLATLSSVDALRRAGQLTLVSADRSPAQSVLSAVKRLDDPFPLFIATADSALFAPQIVDEFCERALDRTEDILVGLAARPVVQSVFPGTRRTFLRFADGAYCGCNLFMVRTVQGLEAIRFWRRAEQFRKKPWRLAGVFGPTLMVSLLGRCWSLEKALSKIGHQLDVTAAPVVLSRAEAAIDVDKVEDLTLVRDYWAARTTGHTR